MKLAVQYEMQRETLDDHRVIEETLEQCILADEMGFDYIWLVEHHFLTGFSASPCPEIFYGALSRLTKQIRLGIGVVVLPYHNPIRVAERVAFLDHLSHGRVDLGTGRSAVYEQTGMGLDPRLTRDMWEESLTMIPKIWESDYFEWEGRFWSAPPRQVLPKPYQNPHPPLWVAALQPSTYKVAAEKGIGVLSFGSSAPEYLKPHIQEYRDTIRNANPVGGAINNQWANSTLGYCGENNREARDLAAQSMKGFFAPDRPYIQGQEDIYTKLLESWGGVPDHLRWMFKAQSKAELDDKQNADSYVEGFGGETIARAIWNEMDADTLCDRGVVIGGDPESCINALKLHEEAGCDQMMILVQTETIPHEKVMKSYELFGKYVIPEFKKSEEKALTASS